MLKCFTRIMDDIDDDSIANVSVIVGQAEEDLNDSENSAEFQYDMTNYAATIYQKIAERMQAAEDAAGTAHDASDDYFNLAIERSVAMLELISAKTDEDGKEIDLKSDSTNSNIKDIQSAYQSQICSIASMYVRMGDYDNAFAYYKLGENQLSTSSTAIAKVYAAHLTDLFAYYGDISGYTDSQKKKIKDLYDEAVKRVPNISSLSNSWKTLKVKVNNLDNNASGSGSGKEGK